MSCSALHSSPRPSSSLSSRRGLTVGFVEVFEIMAMIL